MWINVNICMSIPISNLSKNVQYDIRDMQNMYNIHINLYFFFPSLSSISIGNEGTNWGMWTWRAEQMFAASKSRSRVKLCTQTRGADWALPWSGKWVKVHTFLHKTMHDIPEANAIYEAVSWNGTNHSRFMYGRSISKWIFKACSLFAKSQAATSKMCNQISRDNSIDKHAKGKSNERSAKHKWGC